MFREKGCINQQLLLDNKLWVIVLLLFRFLPFHPIKIKWPLAFGAEMVCILLYPLFEALLMENMITWELPTLLHIPQTDGTCQIGLVLHLLWADFGQIVHGVGELLHLPEALDELYEFDYEFDEHKQEKYAEPEDEHDPQDEQDQNYQAGQIYREADYRQPVVEVPELVEREPLVHVHRQLQERLQRHQQQLEDVEQENYGQASM
jgi:hypothetical protein